jgi:two-component system, NarL family, nitrate/nitrite response regulator NarL
VLLPATLHYEKYHVTIRTPPNIIAQYESTETSSVALFPLPVVNSETGSFSYLARVRIMKNKLDRPINLLLVNEIRLMGNVIVAALEDEPDIDVVACVTTYDEALDVVRESDVDVALVSTRLPDNGGLRLTSAIAEISPSIKVLALGLTEEKKRVLRYVEAGASGYILKDDSLDDLVEIVRATQEGKVFVSPQIAAAMMERLSDLAQLFAGVESNINDATTLTSREMEVLELISKGYTNQQIAQHLVIEVGTVKNHVHNILEKLNVSSRGEAAAYLAFINR